MLKQKRYYPWGYAMELDVVKMRAAGVFYREIAKKYNLHFTTIYHKFNRTGFIFLSLKECKLYGVGMSVRNKHSEF